MREFNAISIPEMSKTDMLMILEALQYTGDNTDIDDFIELKETILEELAYLAEVSPEEMLDILKD